MIEAKLIFGVLIILIFSSLLRIQYSNQLRLYEKIVLIILFLSSIIVVSKPNLLDPIAQYLKIDRGRDLLFYLYMLLSFWGLLRSHIRINKLSSDINKITSQIAIDSPILEIEEDGKLNEN